MKLFSDKLVAEACSACNVSDLSHATIGEILLAAQYLENKTGIPFVRMDQGSPGLPVNRYGVEAEKKALDSGICSQYPAAEGFNGLKEAASRFVKAFIDVDIDPRGCVPTTGSVEGTFAAFIACTQRIPGKNKVLFIDPGFPIQKSQLRILGIEWRNFDIYSWRGAEKLRSRLEEELASGDIAAIKTLAETRFASWDWIYGHSREISLRRRAKLACGTVEAGINLDKGRICELVFSGDFLGDEPSGFVSRRLKGVRLERQDILEALDGCPVEKAFSGADAEDLAELLAGKTE